MALTAEQRRVAREAIREARRMGASRKVIKALISAGLVESNLRNVNYGDRDSLGFLQQRPSQGWGSPRQVRDVRYATRQFVRRAKRIQGQYGSAAELAQAVQRSAFPARYAQRSGDAERVIQAVGGGAGGSSGGGETTTTTTPGVDNSETRRQMLLAYLQQRGRPDALLGLGQGLQQAQDVPATTTTTTTRRARRGGDGQTNIPELARLAQRMGLNVGEHPDYGGVAPVHTQGSYHYRGAALDVSGAPDAMARYARAVKRRYGRDLEELFYRGRGSGLNVKDGRRVGRNFVGGHEGHVHVADAD